jgi:hypothetical protein
MAKSTKSQTNPKPVSEKRLAANRANAAHSTGPRTPDGKARSAQNARKHGLAGTSYAVVRLEDADAVARLRADLIAVYQPVNSQELFALERMALAQLSILRAAQLEAGLFTMGMNDAAADPRVYLEDRLTDNVEVATGQSRAYFMAEGFRRLCAAKGNDPWRVFLRYQAQTERNYRRALEEFERLKALRNELPNEPIDPPQPEETNPIPSREVGQALPSANPSERRDPPAPTPTLQPERINGFAHPDCGSKIAP